MPDRRPGEPDDGVDAEQRGGPGGVLDLRGRPLPHTLRVAVAPDPGREDALVALVDRVVAHGLPGQVAGDGVHRQAVALEDLAAARDVGRVGERLVDLEVVTPAGDLQPVVAPSGGQPGDLLERQVGELSGEQGDGAGHVVPPDWWVRRTARGRRAGSARGDRRPAGLRRGGPLDRVEHPLHLQPLAEGRRGIAAVADVAEEVGHLVGERVLVAEDVPRRPPAAEVRVVGLGHQDPAEAGVAAGTVPS